jgi:hypothetical protein
VRRHNCKGIGAALASIGTSGFQLVTAVIVNSWSVYGFPMGIGMCVGINVLFIASFNRFAFQSVWKESDKNHGLRDGEHFTEINKL